MNEYQFEDVFYDCFRSLKKAAEEGDIDACGDIGRQWRSEIITMYTDHLM